MVNNSPGTIIVGAPGSGKTFAMLNFAANCLGLGQRVIVLDPKDDFPKLYNVNPNIEIVDVNKIRPGALNPFEFLKRVRPDGIVEPLDSATLKTIIELLCGKFDPKTNTEITPIIMDFVTRARTNNYTDLTDVAEYLYSRDLASAQAIGTTLKMFYDNKYGKLLFTKETNVKPLVLSDTSSLVISLFGLELPKYGKTPDQYNDNEKFCSAIVYILTRKLRDILSSKSIIPTTFICDEAQVLFANEEMAGVIDSFLRLGRSLNVATILASQGIASFPDGIANYITTKFMFKSAMEDAQLFLSKFDTSKISPANAIDVNSIVAAATTFPSGTCFMIDRLNRNGIIRIKSIYDVSLLTSNPFAQKEVKENE